MNIYTCGDSHSKFSFFGIDSVKPYWLGPMTMHRVGRDCMDFRTHGIPNDGILILAFGEIDARCHVHKHISGDNEDQVITELVEKYIAAVEKNMKFFKRIAIMSVVPPAMKDKAAENSDLPFLGEDSDRARYTRKMNELLVSNCDRLGIGFLDLYTLYKDEAGMLPFEKSDGIVHIGNNDLVRDALEKFTAKYCRD